MADGLKSPWLDKGQVPFSSASPGGDSVTSSGTDPLVDVGGTPALQTMWPQDKYVVPIPGGEETGNPVSGLPLQPNRFEPSETPPEPPDLTDRNPGTIDKR